MRSHHQIGTAIMRYTSKNLIDIHCIDHLTVKTGHEEVLPLDDDSV
jgi:hypothetical protein